MKLKIVGRVLAVIYVVLCTIGAAVAIINGDIWRITVATCILAAIVGYDHGCRIARWRDESRNRRSIQIK